MDLSPLVARSPNQQGSVPNPQPTEEQQLVSELLGGVAWRTVVETVIVPRVNDLRKKLLTDFTILESERLQIMAKLDEYKTLLTRLYEHTEAAELPGWLEKYFI